MNKRILITGGTGFIGRYLIQEALQYEYDVYVAIRCESNPSALSQFEGIKFIEIDYRDSDQIRRAFQRVAEQVGGSPFHYVIHNAGVTKASKMGEFMEVNAENTRRLLQALQDQTLMPDRLLLMSSMGSYGNNSTSAPLTDDFPQKPNTEYGKSKYQAEQYVIASGIPYTILCPTGVYGYGDEDYWLSIKWMQKGWSFLSGLGPQKLSFVYVKDVASAVFFLLNRTDAEGHRYLLSDGIFYWDKDFTKIMSQLLCRRIREVRIPLPIIKAACFIGDIYTRLTHKPFTLNSDKSKILCQRNWHCDISPLLTLGFNPKYNLKSGMKEALFMHNRNKNN